MPVSPLWPGGAFFIGVAMPDTNPTAVLIDAGFIWKAGRRILGQAWTPDDVVALARACLKEDERLFRIFFYDCLPFDGERIHPATSLRVNYKDNEFNTKRSDFLKELAQRDFIAFRKGRLSHKGWKLRSGVLDAVLSGKKESITAEDVIEDFQQKRVDMKMGLDVAWMSSRRLVEKIILIGSDTDYIPAMKHARREGTQVIIIGFPNPKNDGKPDMHPELMEHADECRILVYEQGLFSIAHTRH